MQDDSKTEKRQPGSLHPAGSAFPLHVRCEIERARAKHKPINSAHEGYSVILEELDEFWDEVKRKLEMRDNRHMYEELVQIAAMAQRTAEDVLDKDRPLLDGFAYEIPDGPER
jgi:vacuolar-type H+-ATPase catalytic subunit A/Vma1